MFDEIDALGMPFLKIKNNFFFFKNTTGIFFRDHQNINFAIQ